MGDPIPELRIDPDRSSFNIILTYQGDDLTDVNPPEGCDDKVLNTSEDSIYLSCHLLPGIRSFLIIHRESGNFEQGVDSSLVQTGSCSLSHKPF